MKYSAHSVIMLPAFVILVTLSEQGHKVKATSITERLLQQASEGMFFDDRDPERSDTILGKLQVLIKIVREMKSGTIYPGELPQQTTPPTHDDDEDKGRPSGSSHKGRTDNTRLLTLLARDLCYAEFIKKGTDPVLLPQLCNISDMVKRTVVQSGQSG